MVEEVPAAQARVFSGSLVHYMLQRPVVKESGISTDVHRASTPLASAKAHNNVSLNKTGINPRFA